MPEIEQRVSDLEAWKAEVTVGLAVDTERRKHMDERFDRVDERLQKIEGAFNKVLWAIGLVMLGQLVKFILDGGLS